MDTDKTEKTKGLTLLNSDECHNSFLYCTKGDDLCRKGKYREALGAYLVAATVFEDKNSYYSYLKLGQAFLKVGLFYDAKNCLKKAIKINPFYWYAYACLGDALLKLGRHKEAKRYYGKVISMDGTKLDEVYENLNICNKKVKDNESK